MAAGWARGKLVGLEGSWLGWRAAPHSRLRTGRKARPARSSASAYRVGCGLLTCTAPTSSRPAPPPTHGGGAPGPWISSRPRPPPPLLTLFRAAPRWKKMEAHLLLGPPAARGDVVPGAAPGEHLEQQPGTVIEIPNPSSLPCTPVDLDLISPGLTDEPMLALALSSTSTCFCACP
jgi:hypothetical protein